MTSEEKLKRAVETIQKWNKTGYYDCNRCGWKGDFPLWHNLRCRIKAVFVKPMK